MFNRKSQPFWCSLTLIALMALVLAACTAEVRLTFLPGEHWQVEAELVMSADELAAMGGEEVLEASLEERRPELEREGIAYRWWKERLADGAVRYVVRLEGQGLDLLNRTYFFGQATLFVDRSTRPPRITFALNPAGGLVPTAFQLTGGPIVYSNADEVIGNTAYWYSLEPGEKIEAVFLEPGIAAPPPTPTPTPTVTPPPTATPTPPPTAGTAVCGQVQWDLSAGSRFIGFMFPVVISCETGDVLIWNPPPSSSSPDAWYRIEGVQVEPLCPPEPLQSGRTAVGRIAVFSRYEPIPSCADCGRLPPTLAPCPQGEANLKLVDFAVTPERPVVFQPNTLQLIIQNVGEGPFVPQNPDYSVQVVLKKAGQGKLEEYDYTPERYALLPSLPIIRPKETWTLTVQEAFFFTAVQDAQLEVFFRPRDPDDLSDNLVAKTISIEPHPESFWNCAAHVAKAVSLFIPEVKLVELAFELLDCGIDLPCAATAIAKTIVSFIKDIGELIALILDIASEMNKPPACSSAVDWLIAILKQIILQGVRVNGLVLESPAYVLVTNQAGQRVGFLDDGTIVEEIPDARAVVQGDTKIVLYPGSDTAHIRLKGAGDGTANLHMVLTQPEGGSTALSYRDIPVRTTSVGELSVVDHFTQLRMDQDADGAVDDFFRPMSVSTVPAPVPRSAMPRGSSAGAVVVVGLVLAVVVIGGILAAATRPGGSRVGRQPAGAGLYLMEGRGAPRLVAIRRPGFRIGRDSRCDLVPADAQISHFHAEIRLERGAYMLYDLRSVNGTFVNGKQIKRTTLQDGDRIKVGNTEMVFRAWPARSRERRFG